MKRGSGGSARARVVAARRRRVGVFMGGVVRRKWQAEGGASSAGRRRGAFQLPVILSGAEALRSGVEGPLTFPRVEGAGSRRYEV